MKLIIFVTLALLATSPFLEAGAASKKASNRSDYTAAQQKKFYEEALRAWRKKYGARLHYAKVDYRKRQYICYYY